MNEEGDGVVRRRKFLAWLLILGLSICNTDMYVYAEEEQKNGIALEGENAIDLEESEHVQESEVVEETDAVEETEPEATEQEVIIK